MALVDAVNLTRRFGDITAVDGVSLAVERGEVVGFLGPNGAGKTTTMRMIAGFLEPDSGSVKVCGHDVLTDPIEARRRLGYLPEGAPAYPEMLVADFLRFVGRIRGLSGRTLEARLADMIDMVRLEEVWSRPIEALSKGFRRRVAIAQALIHDPDVLILDEPTDGLDPNQKHDMRGLIGRIAPKKAIVVSTHILEEVEAVCSRAVIIAGGRVVADGTPDELVSRVAVSAIRLTVAVSDLETARAHIAPVPGVEGIEMAGTSNGAARLTVHTTNGAGRPSELAAALAEAGIVIEEIGLQRPRLEDVFREITREKTH
jgi:ABC-2 type transport system ATP-binding protein